MERDEKHGSRKIPPGKVPTRKISAHQTSHWKLHPPPIPPRKILTQKIPIRNISTDFINCISSLNTSFGQLFTNLKIRKTKV